VKVSVDGGNVLAKVKGKLRQQLGRSDGPVDGRNVVVARTRKTGKPGHARPVSRLIVICSRA
jgi:hypothetical protein